MYTKEQIERALAEFERLGSVQAVVTLLLSVRSDTVKKRLLSVKKRFLAVEKRLLR